MNNTFIAQKGKKRYNVIAQKGGAFMNINKNIGSQLKKYRELRGYSLSYVGELLGKSKSSIHAYEIGKVSIAVDVLKSLCNIYGVDFIVFLETVQKMNSSAEKRENKDIF